MRLAHKRKVQLKLSKSIKVSRDAVKRALNVEPSDKPTSKLHSALTTNVTLTPKQQQVFNIINVHPKGLSSKNIGLMAGQEETKAASWATGALKKLVDGDFVVREQQAGNKVIYLPK